MCTCRIRYVNKNDPKFGFDEDFFVNWEPGIADGPTSARFAVVDYNGDTETIIPMAIWDDKQEAFLAPDKTILEQKKQQPATISPGKCVGCFTKGAYIF